MTHADLLRAHAGRRATIERLAATCLTELGQCPPLLQGVVQPAAPERSDP